MSDVDPDMVLSCPICMEKYSETRYPIAPYCGHSICKECGDKRKSNQCVSCTVRCFYDGVKKTSPWPSSHWNKNYTLLDIVNLYATKMKSVEDQDNALKLRYKDAILLNDVDYKECSRCETMEKRERLNICGTCAEKKNVDWKGMEEEEILHAILCAHCCMKEHSGHKIIDYLPWKLKQVLSSTVTDGNSTVFSMDEICSYEVEKGKEELGKWNEDLNSFSALSLNSYREGLSIASSLKLESDLVTRVSEDCIPPLRRYRKVVTDSTSRLQLLKQEVCDGEFDIEKSKIVQKEITQLLEKPSQLLVPTGDYEESIRKLEQKLEDKEKKLKDNEEKLEDSHAVVKKMMATVHCKRLFVGDHFLYENWKTRPEHVNCLFITVSHQMTLLAIDMYGALEETEQMGRLTIILPDSDDELTLVDQHFALWDGTKKYSRKIMLANSLKLSPDERYLLEVRVDGVLEVFNGGNGTDDYEICPGQLVTFQECDHYSERNCTDVFSGQFPGFHFLIEDE